MASALRRAAVAGVVGAVLGGLASTGLVSAAEGDSFVVVLRDPRGRALSADKVRLSLRGSSPIGGASIAVCAEPGAGGTLIVPMDAPAPFATKTEWWLEAESRVWGTQLVPLDDRVRDKVRVQFQVPARFRVKFVGAEEPLRSRLFVKLARPGQDDTAAFNNRFDDAVQPGRWNALVMLDSGDGFRHRVLARTAVDLQPGANELALRVPTLHPLAVRIPDAAPGTEVYVESARRPGRDGFVPSSRVREDGRVLCPELPPGLYTITWDREQRQMVVRVPAPGDVQFAPAEVPGFHVSVEDPRGLLARAGFETGDVIVRIDGKVPGSLARADRLLHDARERDEVPVDVDRGGVHIRLRIDPAKLWSSARCGGWWEPVPR